MKICSDTRRTGQYQEFKINTFKGNSGPQALGYRIWSMRELTTASGAQQKRVFLASPAYYKVINRQSNTQHITNTPPPPPKKNNNKNNNNNNKGNIIFSCQEMSFFSSYFLWKEKTKVLKEKTRALFWIKCGTEKLHHMLLTLDNLLRRSPHLL